MRRHAKVWFAIAALASFFAFAGSASAAYTFKGTFAGPGAGNGELDTPGRTALEPSTGRLFVVDSGNNRVQVFSPKSDGTGEYLTQFGNGELSEPWGIAIDEAAGQTYVYVADAGNERIVKYDSDGQETPSFSVDGSFASPAQGSGAGEVGSFHAALAIDPTSHDLLVADNANKLIERFESDGTFVSSFDGSDGHAAFEGPIDLAVNSTGDVYVIDANGDVATQGGTSRALRYSGTGEFKATLPEVGTQERVATVAIDPDTDEVLISGDQDNVYESRPPPPYLPVLGLFDASNNPLPSPGLAASAQFDTVSGLALAGGHMYVVLGLGNWNGLLFGAPQIQAFEVPPPVAPTIKDQFASPTSREAVLGATINPGNADTEYRFEYGPTSAYGSSTPAVTLPEGNQGVGVRTRIAGLTPGATYHFRVVAKNSAAGVPGDDQVFTTPQSPAPQGCGNEALREAQASLFLPDCRAFELVSPARKFGYPYGGQLKPISELEVSPDGEHLTYSSFYPLPTAQVGSAGGYAAQRSVAGWTAGSLFPSPGPHQVSNGLPGKDMSLRGSTPDGRTSVYFDNTTTPGPTLAIVRPDGSRQAIAMGSRYGLPNLGVYGSNPGQPWFAGISADGRHVIFADSDRLLPGLPAGSEDILYEWEDGGGAGVLRVVDRDNGPSLGLLNSEGAELGGSGAGLLARGSAATGARHAISTDGSRIFFQSPAWEGSSSTPLGGGPVFLRADATETIEISAPEPAYTPTNPPTLYQYLDAAADGHIAFFWANGDLTEGAPTDGAIYSYEPGPGRLELVGAAPDVGGAPPTAIASADGSHLYYEEGDKVIDHSGGSNQVVSEGLLVQGGLPFPDGRIESSRGIEANACPTAGTTTDGDYFVFMARVGSTGAFDALTGNPIRVYRYDAQSGAPAQPITALHDLDGNTVDSGFPLTGSCSLAFGRPAEPRLLSDDGSRVFFTGAGSYSAADTNGTFDAYEWHNGQISLLSSGKSPSGSFFQGTDKEGRNAFLVTTQPLVGWDIDRVLDIYDARVEGGFPEPPSPPAKCEGEDCQSPSGSQSAGAPGSSTLAAAGNHNARKHAKKKRRKESPCKKKGKGTKAKKRCQAKKAHKRAHASSTKKATGQGGSK